MAFTLDDDRLIEEATRDAGLDDFGDLPFREGLRVLVASLRDEAGLDEKRTGDLANILKGFLTKRLRLVNDRKRIPQIADQIIKAPIFITGMPRTGSTHLHALMATCEGVRVPAFWEMMVPSPPPERATYTSDTRIAQIQKAVEQFPVEALKRHPMAATRAEQCIFLLDTSLINIALPGQYRIPTYRDWILNSDLTPAYEGHRRTLQHLQLNVGGQWVLKYPKHLMGLDALLSAYPDARFIWTHRDPATSLPSVASLVGYWRSLSPGYDPRKVGPEWVALEELCLLRGLDARERAGNKPKQWLDIHYADMMRDPAGTVERICNHFDMPYSDETRKRVEAWLQANPQTKHGVHEYAAEDFGLKKAQLRERFSFYTKRFNVL